LAGGDETFDVLGEAPAAVADAGEEEALTDARVEADAEGGQDRAPQIGRGGHEAEHDEQPDLGEPTHPLDETARCRPVRKPCVAQIESGEVNGEEAARVQNGRGAVRSDTEREHRQRIEPGRRQRDATHPPRADPAHG